MRFTPFFLTFGLAIMMTLSLPAQSVRVIFVSGKADIQRPEETTPHPATKGETVIIGTRIVTGADGRVVLTPMPGVKSIITPNTTILLESVSEIRTSASEVKHQAVLDLKEGAVVTDLNKPEGVTYDYSIRTARGLAGARGTTFTVGINKAGVQTIVVAHGTIFVSFIDGSRASLAPGQLSITKPNGTTESVGSIDALPEADRKIAQTWTETTLSAISDAVSAGIEIDPAALNNALDAAKNLGVPLPPELKAAVEGALNNTETAPPPEKAPPPEGTSTTPTAAADPTPPPPSGPPLPPAPPPPPTVVTDIVTTPITSTLSAYRGQLTSTQAAIFDTLPTDIQNQLATLNDAAITRVALELDRESGLPITDQDLRFHLDAFIRLPETTFDFVKTLAGAQFDNGPDPAEWSLAAFDRTQASWNALTPTERNLIVTLGAGDAIMDVSAGYISGLLAALTPTQQGIITDLGWGSALAELAGKPTSQPIFTAAASLTTAERATVKFFEIDPGNFRNPNIGLAVQTLAALSPADQKTLRELGISHVMLDSGGFQASPPPDYAGRVANTLAFYNALSPDQQTAARALGLGYLLYNYAPSDTLGQSSVTALQRVATLAQFYTACTPALQQAVRDTGLFRDPSFLTNPASFNATLATNTLTTYINLPARTRLYLTTQDKSYRFFDLANPGSNSPYRTLSQINSLLGALSAEEFATLTDMKLSKAVIETGANDNRVPNGYLGTNPLQTLRITLSYYGQLDAAKKSVLRELGIVGDSNIALIGADTEGLNRLLTAYSTLPNAVRAGAETLDEGFSNNSTYGNLNNPSTPVDRSFFFPRGIDASFVMQKVAFKSTGDLHVGATRYLRINNSALGTATFTVGAQKDLHVYASDLIDLNTTAFSGNIRGITMAAATINLANITFPDGSVASLNSKLGQVNFLGVNDPVSTNNGKINFKNVSYGPHLLNSAADLAAPTGANGNIATGTLANPAPLPTYQQITP